MVTAELVKFPTKKIEKNHFANGYRYVIGVDEVGMGCLAGPVVVCAVAFNKKFFAKTHRRLFRLRDSKLLNAKQREIFAEELKKTRGFKYQLAYCFPKTIDKMNIYQAARRAMRRAVKKFKLPREKTIVLVDGKTEIDGLGLPQQAIIKGDRKVFTIACASVIAKVYRDRMMLRYAKRFPNYGFEQHKGYGTKFHVAQLMAMGPSEIHRFSFAPLVKLIK